MSSIQSYTAVPTSIIKDIYFESMNYLDHQESSIQVSAPLATYETTLFHSVSRGAKCTRHTKNLTTTILQDLMTRSVLFETNNALQARELTTYVQSSIVEFQQEVVSKQSKHAILDQVQTHQVGNLLYVRFVFRTGNASGHNMTTFASDALATYILQKHPHVKYLSVSGNFCVDKKVSAVNSILGRGKSVIAEMWISREICTNILRTTPEKMVELNIKKNFIGSISSGSIMSANAHYANMLLAFYIATGQDGANIVEGSQGVTHCEVIDDQLYFSVSIPNIIVGSIGHGKNLEGSRTQLEKMGCIGPYGAQRCAQIAAALVLCGELSLMAALTNQFELTNSHSMIERVSNT